MRIIMDVLYYTWFCKHKTLTGSVLLRTLLGISSLTCACLAPVILVLLGRRWKTVRDGPPCGGKLGKALGRDATAIGHVRNHIGTCGKSDGISAGILGGVTANVMECVTEQRRAGAEHSPVEKWKRTEERESEKARVRILEEEGKSFGTVAEEPVTTTTCDLVEKQRNAENSVHAELFVRHTRIADESD